MDVHEKLISFFDSLSITYTIIEHGETPSSLESAKARGEPLKIGAKAIIVKSKHGFSLCVMPADRRLDTKVLKKVLRSKSLRFASLEELEEITGLCKGAVPPFGCFFALNTIVDPLLFSEENVAFNAASLVKSVKMKSVDYKKALESFGVVGSDDANGSDTVGVRFENISC